MWNSPATVRIMHRVRLLGIVLPLLLLVPDTWGQDPPTTEFGPIGRDDEFLCASEFGYEEAYRALHETALCGYVVEVEDEEWIQGYIPMPCTSLRFTVSRQEVEARRPIEMQRAIFDFLTSHRRYCLLDRTRARSLARVHAIWPRERLTWEAWMERLPAWHEELMADAATLLDSPRRSNRLYAARWIFDCCREADQDLILRILDDPEDIAEMSAGHAEWGIPLSDQVLERVMAVIPRGDDYESWRHGSFLRLLRATSNPRADSCIRRLFAELPSDAAKLEALDALAPRKSAENQPFFRELLAHVNSSFRSRAAQGLMAIRDENDLPLLWPLLEDEDHAVARTVIEVLAYWEHPDVARRLLALLQHDNLEIARAVASSLIKHRRLEGVDWFVKESPTDWRGRPDVPYTLKDGLAWPFPGSWGDEEALAAEWERFQIYWKAHRDGERSWSDMRALCFEEAIRRAREAVSSAPTGDRKLRSVVYCWMRRGLTSENLLLRRRAIQTLAALTEGDTLGYDPEAAKDLRRAAVDEWHAWAHEE